MNYDTLGQYLNFNLTDFFDIYFHSTTHDLQTWGVPPFGFANEFCLLRGVDWVESTGNPVLGLFLLLNLKCRSCWDNSAYWLAVKFVSSLSGAVHLRASVICYRDMWLPGHWSHVSCQFLWSMYANNLHNICLYHMYCRRPGAVPNIPDRPSIPSRPQWTETMMRLSQNGVAESGNSDMTMEGTNFVVIEY